MSGTIIRDGIWWVGAVDWERRVFDELIPIPEGTTYNAYLVRGSERTVLVDTVEPKFTGLLMERLDLLGVNRLDHVVVNHAEQDHSGSLQAVLERFPEASVLATAKARGLLVDHLGVDAGKIRPVDDGATLGLGGKTLRFIHFPWVHWPETMLTLVEEDRVLFTCDLFGSHLATADPRDADEGVLLSEAKRYYAQIMMCFRGLIAKNLPKVESLSLDLIAPSHGPVVQRPQLVVDAYRDWVGDTPRNRAVLAYSSMHASTHTMVRHLSEALVARGVGVDVFGLAEADLGKLATALVDAATLVLGSPIVNGGAHPLVAYAAFVANMLKPKARHAAVIGSYGWGGKMVDQLVGLMPSLKLELLDPVLAKGLPKAADLAALDRLAEEITARHAGLAR